MRRGYAARVEGLEGRNLPSGAHRAAVATRGPSTPLAVVGTLAVENRATTVTTNPDGSTTTTVPVAGTLGSLGRVSGVWDEKDDVSGDISGPDVLRLRDAAGSFVLTFNDEVPGPPHPFGPGTVERAHTEHLFSATGAYVGDSESGPIEVVSDTSGRVLKSLVLDGRPT